ncbi:ecdysone-induced protein 75B-like [Tigriopus californicus]|uniref:ecdysone-induced protein 75B-like n=1 Tax=Tigriopus californicus TaxID=6832 RepID=UPI0027DA4D1B|nr:ecdysone-induced protein 75B-like [Tigriopus californicus]
MVFAESTDLFTHYTALRYFSSFQFIQIRNLPHTRRVHTNRMSYLPESALPANYPNRKRRILDTFSPISSAHYTGHMTNASSGDNDDNDDIEVVCVISRNLGASKPIPISPRHHSLPAVPSMHSGFPIQGNREWKEPQSHPIQLSLRSEWEPSPVVMSPPPPPPLPPPPLLRSPLLHASPAGQVLPPLPSLQCKPMPRTSDSPLSLDPVAPRQFQKACKVVQKLSDNTWIEIDLPLTAFQDGKGLERVSNTIQSLATSCNLLTSGSPKTNCHCHESVPGLGRSPKSSIPVQNLHASIDTPTSSKSPIEESSYNDLDLPSINGPTCSICNAPAESFHLNYGASSCYSCRAFFRRSVQKNIHQRFTCHYGRRCVLNPHNRSDCRRCRFEKCVQEGMKIASVLSHNQKMVRFRKHIGRKQLEKINETMEMKKALRAFRKTQNQSAVRFI